MSEETQSMPSSASYRVISQGNSTEDAEIKEREKRDQQSQFQYHPLASVNRYANTRVMKAVAEPYSYLFDIYNSAVRCPAQIFRKV